MSLRRTLLPAVLIVLQATAVFSQAPPTKKKAKPATKVVTSLPRIPVAVHDALQSRKFAEAVTAIDAALKQKKVVSPDYLLYLKGRAQTELKQYPQATATYSLLEKTYPKSGWLARSRFGRADVLARQRNYQAAGAIYQTEARRLLSSGRKDELIAIYLEYADRYYEGVAAKDPSAKKQPDYAQALTYYREGVKLSPSLAKRQRIELRIGRCLQELKKYAESNAAYRNFIAQYASEKTKADRRAPTALEVEARYQLGRSLLAGGNPAEARRVWQDFLSSDIGKKSGGDLLPEAMYGLARTHGVPAPPSIASLEQGVAALEKFVKTYPKHKLAPKASYEIAQSYIHHGRYEDAITRLKAFIAGPYSASEQVATARRLLGRSYFAQKKFTDAIAAWHEFLGKHPTDKNWSGIQKSVVDTEYLMASEQRQRKNYDAARKLWSTFLNKYPLDARSARVLFEFGSMRYQTAATQYKKDNEKAVAAGDKPKLLKATQTLFEQAIADWQRLASKYPGTNEASQAAYMTGITLEDRLGKLADALKAYQKVTGSYAGQAKQRIEKLTSKNLELITERKFHSNEKPRIRLTTRNLEKVTVKVYRIDLAAYFRKMHLATGVEKLDIALIDPDESWEYDVAGYEKYKQVQNDVTIPIDGPGVIAVTVVGEKLEATTMVIVSDLDIIVKSSRNELFVFAENVRTGKPAEGVSLLVSDGSKVFAEEITGKDGVLQKSYKELKSVADLRVFAVQEGHAASTVSRLAGLDFAIGLSPKGYLYSDRPAYRAGQLVNLKGVVRWVTDDRYVFKAGEKYQLDIYDARGRVIRTQEVKLDKFGTFADRFSLPKSSPQGSYRVRLHQPGGKQSYETTFTVHEYRLEPVRLAVDLPRKVYYRGETIEGKITLKYYYGTPISGRSIRYRLGNDRLHTATTDAKGEVAFKFETAKYSESQPLPLYVDYPERSLATGETIFLATRAFGIGVATLRSVYITGETFDATVAVTDPAGKPVGTKLKLEVFERTVVDGKRGEKLIATHEVTSDEKTGEVRHTLRVDKSGTYIIRATGTDRFKQTISGSHVVAISGEEDTVRLRILADAHYHKVGDTAKVQLHWREKPALALVTYEGAKVLGYRLVQLKTGANPLAIPMQSHLAPNFVLSVAVMKGSKFHQASSEFRVSRKLHIKIEPSATTLEPGADLKVDVTVTDAQGRPVVASVSLGLIQQNLLARFGDTHGAIDAFFNGGYRRPSVRVATSCRFEYRPTTKGISKFLLAENARRNANDAENKSLIRLTDEFATIMSREKFNRSGNKRDLNAIEDLANMETQRLQRQVATALEIAQYAKNSNPDAALQTLRQALGNVQRDDDAQPESRAQLIKKLGRTIQGIERERDQIEQRLVKQAVDISASEARRRSGFRWEMFRGEWGGKQVGQRMSGGVDGPGPGRMAMDRALEELPLGGRQGKGNRRGDANDAGGSGADFDSLIDQIMSQTSGPWHDIDDIPSRYETTLKLVIRQTQKVHPQTRLILDDVSNSEKTILGLNLEGELQVVNGLPIAQLEKLAKAGLEILPGRAASETGYWNPTIITDAKGKATVTFKLPVRSTAWMLRSKGVNADALAGQTDVEIITKKDLFGALKTPLAFHSGDKPKVIVEVHNSIVKKGEKIKVTLTSTVGDRTIEVKRTLDSSGPGIQELTIPVDITNGDDVVFELTVASGEKTDVTTTTVPIRPFGMPVFATRSGSSAQSTIVLIDHDDRLDVQQPRMEILIGSSLDRTLLDAVLGSGSASFCEMAALGSGIERSVSDVLGGVALLKMTGASRSTDTPEAQALAGRIASQVAGLVSSQRNDGGWSWSGKATAKTPDRYLSSRIMWVLARARNAGFAIPNATFDKGVQYLRSAFSASAQSDLNGQAILLHGLTEAGAGDFAFANRLYRERNGLSPAGLLHVALVLARLDRKEMAAEVLKLVEIPTDPKTAGQRAADSVLKRVVPWMRNSVELRALYLLALEEIDPTDVNAGQLAEWLMAARRGSRWSPEKANGPAIAALADWFARSKHVKEKYTLSVFVNEKLVEKLTIDPTTDGVRKVSIPKKLLAAKGGQKINLDMEGRGRFSYSVVLAGFVAADKLASTTTSWKVTRTYEPAQRMLDGQVIPRGFGVLSGSYETFRNPLTQLPLGERGEVTLRVRRLNLTSSSTTQLDYLIVTEPIPAGATVLANSIRGSYERYEVSPGQITFYLGDSRSFSDIRYTLVGYLPGNYRAVPTLVRSFYEPGRIAISTTKSLDVLSRGGKSKDAYKLTPIELYEFGKRLAAKRDYDGAHQHLTALFKDYRLNNGTYQTVVRLLFQVALELNRDDEIVAYFEIVKEKFPEVEIDFPSILKVASAYRELGEYERSYLVYRATIEAGFERESQIAGFLDARGEFVRSVEVMESLLRDYPAESYIATATYALAQEVYGKAPLAAADAKLKKAEITRVELIASAIGMLDHYVSTWPTDPATDQASFSLANALLDLEQYANAIARCEKFAARYPESKLRDSYWYVIGYCQFAMGKHKAALEMCKKVAEATRKDPKTGIESPAANKWQAIYIMGQVHHSLGEAAAAIAEYGRVKERFADANEAIDFFTRKAIKLPEITTVMPGVAVKVPLEFRNVPSASVKVYRIDLLKFGLLQRNLDRITAINLAGIRPYHEVSLKLGDGKDYRDRKQEMALPLKEEGAYLVVCRGENLYTSGLVLVTPLKLEIQEDKVSGRVRVTVKDTAKDRYIHDVHVKVIGSANKDFTSGETDLRGIFAADAIRGTSTVIAKAEGDRYAFFRGKMSLGNVPTGQPAAPAKSPQADGRRRPSSGKDALLKNLRRSNFDFQKEQQKAYKGLLQNKKSGVKAKAAY